VTGPATHKEFFAVRTVAEVLAGFRPGRRTRVETVPLADAHGRVPAEPVAAPHDLPGFARSTVDGFAAVSYTQMSLPTTPYV
jgi:molybdopterin molybdotransferase